MKSDFEDSAGFCDARAKPYQLAAKGLASTRAAFDAGCPDVGSTRAGTRASTRAIEANCSFQ